MYFIFTSPQYEFRSNYLLRQIFNPLIQTTKTNPTQQLFHLNFNNSRRSLNFKLIHSILYRSYADFDAAALILVECHDKTPNISYSGLKTEEVLSC